MTLERWLVACGFSLSASFGVLFALEKTKSDRLQKVIDSMQIANETAKTADAQRADKFQSELMQLRPRLILLRAMLFERANDFRFAGNCQASGSSYFCDTTTWNDVPVRFHCDVDGCAIDCGAVK